MSTGDATSQAALGFLTVLTHEQHGLTGGFLILNAAGRPLEFHCTAPIKPNRAQRILFGPTLEPYLYGEQIGQTLLAKASLAPLAICTDVELVLAVRDFTDLPVALVHCESPGEPASSMPAGSEPTWRVDTAHLSARLLNCFEMGRNRLSVPVERDGDRLRIVEQLAGLAALDLAEPFVRIREAIEEAHKVGRS